MPKTSSLIMIASLAVVAAACVLTPRSCMTQHSRPIGHNDISIEISPSDDLLVFNASGSGTRDLYLFRLTDQHVTRVADTTAYEVTPDFSPDGKQIVYAAGLPGDRADHIFIRPVDGGPARQLTHADANDTAPRVSPDGSLVVFARDKTYNWGGLAHNWSDGGVICVVGIDGQDERQLTEDAETAGAPFFSSDGQSILFSDRGGLFSVPVNGSRRAEKVANRPGYHGCDPPVAAESWVCGGVSGDTAPGVG